MFSTEQLLRIASEDREREVQAELRMRSLLLHQRPAIRWLHRSSRPVPRHQVLQPRS